MQTATSGVLPGTDRFDYAEDLITRYPHITDAEVKDLKKWFKKEASAFDVANLASKESIYNRYTAFRAEHVDRFTAKDYALAASVIMLALAGIFYMAL